MEFKNLSLTAVFVKELEGGYSAFIEEIPGVNTQGETMDEARENFKDALTIMDNILPARLAKRNEWVFHCRLQRQPFTAKLCVLFNY